MKTWFEVKAATGGEKKAEVMIFGEIGGCGVSAADFTSQLSAIPEDNAITVRINSNGGSVTEGYAIYNALKRRANVTTIVEGIAASMASVIMLAGSKIQANANSLIVIHNPLLIGATGNAEELRKMASDIEKIGTQIAGIYATATGKSEADVKAAMDFETMFTAEEAKEWGLIHEVIPDTESTGAQNMLAAMLVKMKAQITATTAELGRVTGAHASALEAEKAAHAATQTALASLKEAAAKQAADAFVSEAIAAGKLTEDARAKFAEMFIKDAAEARSVVDALRPPIGAAPVEPENKDEAGGDAVILAEYRALTGNAKTDFYAKNKDAIWRAASAQ